MCYKTMIKIESIASALLFKKPLYISSSHRKFPHSLPRPSIEEVRHSIFSMEVFSPFRINFLRGPTISGYCKLLLRSDEGRMRASRSRWRLGDLGEES
jgi:hypothetical protein